MEDSLIQAGVNLGEVAIRNTATIVYDKMRKAKANKDKEKIIYEYEEIIDGLINDKQEAVRIAKIYENDIINQRITDKDIDYISDNIIPFLKAFLPTKSNEFEKLEKLLSKETLRVLQLVGFNFKEAIGQPLTLLLRNTILQKTNIAQRESEMMVTKMIDLAKDKDSYERFNQLSKLGNQS